MFMTSGATLGTSFATAGFAATNNLPPAVTTGMICLSLWCFTGKQWADVVKEGIRRHRTEGNQRYRRDLDDAFGTSVHEGGLVLDLHVSDALIAAQRIEKDLPQYSTPKKEALD